MLINHWCLWPGSLPLSAAVSDQNYLRILNVFCYHWTISKQFPCYKSLVVDCGWPSDHRIHMLRVFSCLDLVLDKITLVVFHCFYNLGGHRHVVSNVSGLVVASLAPCIVVVQTAGMFVELDHAFILFVHIKTRSTCVVIICDPKLLAHQA